MFYNLEVIAFDVLETMFSLKAVEDRLRDAGLPPAALKPLFAGMLRDAFALDAAGTPKPFQEIVHAELEVLMANHGMDPDRDAVLKVLQAFTNLCAYDDVRPALAAVRAAGVRVITLTNGSAANTRKLLRNAGVENDVEKTLSVEAVGHWKPNAAVYLYAAKECDVAPARMALVAAHAWDTHGAKQVGMVTGWVQRQDKRYMTSMSPPDVTGTSLTEVVTSLLAA